MDYGALLRRAWDIVWEHKFLILLGLMVALGSGGSSSGGGYASGGGRDAQPPEGMPQLPEDWSPQVPVLAGVALVVVVSIAILIGLALWVIGTLGRGGLIVGAAAIDAGGTSNFGAAVSGAWNRIWRLLGIGFLPAIPVLIMVLGGIGVSGGALLFSEMGVPADFGFLSFFGALACIALPLAFVLGLLRTFANRACMLENLGVLESYRRGIAVLMENAAPALLLFIIQVAIRFGLGLLLFLPALCCLLWPLLIVVQGGISAYFSTLWTLAWRRWTGEIAAADV